MSDKIEKGDKVKVFFNNGRTIQGIVNYVPVATGDAWIIKARKCPLIVYIQQYDYMILESKSGN